MITSFTLPSGDRYIRETDRPLFYVPHFYERSNFTVPRPDPEVYRLNPFDLTLLTSDWQWFWFDVIVAEVKGTKTMAQLMQAWGSLTGGEKVITNGRGTDTCADYIRLKNLDQRLPAYYPLVFGGTCLAGQKTTKRGVRVLQVEHLDGSKDPPENVSPATHPWLFQYGTNTTTKKLTKKPPTYQINRFSQLSPYGSPFLVLAREEVTYPLELLKELPAGTPVPSPYNP